MLNEDFKFSYTIRDQVYKILKEEILSGTLKPGKQIKETELATIFKVSRSPIREALRQLTGDELVETIPNKGVFVKVITEKDIRDTLELRLLLEREGIDCSKKNLTPELKKRLLDIKDEMINDYKIDDLNSYAKHDTLFHTIIVELCRNDLILKVSAKIYDKTLLFRKMALGGENRFKDSLDEHILIIDSILSSDINTARKELDKHLSITAEKTIEAISKFNNDK